MGFFRKGHKPDGAQSATATGLVIDAPAPPEGGPRLGPGAHATGRVQADLGSGSRLFDVKLRMSEEHWLAPGMDVALRFDPEHPNSVAIDWERMPSMEERVAANEPALTDPVAARRGAMSRTRWV